jgi:hypothetical protein
MQYHAAHAGEGRRKRTPRTSSGARRKARSLRVDPSVARSAQARRSRKRTGAHVEVVENEGYFERAIK